MSRRNNKRRKEVRALQVKEVEDFSRQPVKHDTGKASRIMDWLLCLSEDSSAVGELFPMPGNVMRDLHG